MIGLFPAESDLRWVEISISGLHPAQALSGVLRDSPIFAGMVEETIQILCDVLKVRRAEIQAESAAAAVAETPNVDMAWADEVFRLRLADPNRGVEHGDPIDLLHLLYASMTDAAVLDRTHSGMVKASKARKFWVGRRVDELIEYLERPAL